MSEATHGRVLSWIRLILHYNFPHLFSLMAFLTFIRISKYISAVTILPLRWYSVRRTPFWSQKLVSSTLLVEGYFLNFHGTYSFVSFQTFDLSLSLASNNETNFLLPLQFGLRNNFLHVQILSWNLMRTLCGAFCSFSIICMEPITHTLSAFSEFQYVCSILWYNYSTLKEQVAKVPARLWLFSISYNWAHHHRSGALFYITSHGITFFEVH